MTNTDTHGLDANHCRAVDQARNRTGNGVENLALLRRMALNLARTEPTKGSMRGKIKKAGWSDNFMLDMIRAAIQL